MIECVELQVYCAAEETLVDKNIKSEVDNKTSWNRNDDNIEKRRQ